MIPFRSFPEQSQFGECVSPYQRFFETAIQPDQFNRETDRQTRAAE
jgi:hypothetical protein